LDAQGLALSFPTFDDTTDRIGIEETRKTMAEELGGRVALVTGASRGIGLAIAQRLAKGGATVVVTARSMDPGDDHLPGSLVETVDLIREMGGNAYAFAADMGEESDRERLVADVTAAVGSVDILVNNAAITFLKTVEQFTLKRLRLMTEVTVTAPFHLSQLVLPGMHKKGRGAIVNVSSPAAKHPAMPYPRNADGGVVYGMCKAAIDRFTTGLAMEQQRHGVAVNAVYPGFVATPGVLAHGLLTEETRLMAQPPEMTAEVVAYFADVAAADITGQIVSVRKFLEARKVSA
jgi:citronellol/citronellal dehydrogenase